MLRRRHRSTSAGPRAAAAVAEVLALVEEAKSTLLLGIPSGRRARLPMAEALAGFEQGLSVARATMDRWRIPELEAAFTACREAMNLSLGRAERLRLEAPSDAYEDLVPALDELLDPLEVLTEAAETLRRTGS